MAKESSALLEKENEFRPEIGTRLNISAKGGKAPMESVFVGSKPPEYLVITPLQQIEFIKDLLSNGLPLAVTYLQEGRTLEFQARIMEIVHSPVELVLLEYPMTVQERNLRSHKRISCFISGTIEVEMATDGGVITGVIKDISKSGCCFLIKGIEGAEMMFQLYEQILLRCKFPGIAGEREALGKVVDIRKREDGIAIGIRFSDTMWWVPPYA